MGWNLSEIQILSPVSQAQIQGGAHATDDPAANT
jgi:hypothetical protein